MHEHGLAKELWPQLQKIAESQEFARVTSIEMIVGSLHGVSADFLAHSFEHAFEGSNFEGATVQITIVDPDDEYAVPPADEQAVATGWELLVTRIEGDK